MEKILSYYIENQGLIEAPTRLNYIQYKPYLYNNNSFKKYIAFIRQADGSYLKVKPYIYTTIEMAIAGLAIPGISRATNAIALKSLDNYILKDCNDLQLKAYN